VDRKLRFDNSKKSYYTQNTFTNYLYLMSTIFTPENNSQVLEFRENAASITTEAKNSEGLTFKVIHKLRDSLTPIHGDSHGFFMQGYNLGEGNDSRKVFSVNCGGSKRERKIQLEGSSTKGRELTYQTLVNIINSGEYSEICLQDVNLTGAFELEQLREFTNLYNITYNPTHNFVTLDHSIESGTLTFNNFARGQEEQFISIVPEMKNIRKGGVNIVSEDLGQVECALSKVLLWNPENNRVTGNGHGSFFESPSGRMENTLLEIGALNYISNLIEGSPDIVSVADRNYYGTKVNTSSGISGKKFIPQLLGKLRGQINPNAEGLKVQQILEGTNLQYLMPEDYTFLGESRLQEIIMQNVMKYTFDAAIADRNSPASISTLKTKFPGLDHRPIVISR
jgi:hypothetical protein